jgi:hypothetical protein
MVVEHEQLVRQAGGGDVKAFVELTRRFQQFAFGSALALVRDFRQAEDVVQEAFVAAWKALLRRRPLRVKRCRDLSLLKTACSLSFIEPKPFEKPF